MAKDRVLFVDTDGARSQMAAAILAKYGGEQFEPCCAAVAPGRADCRVTQVLGEHGLEVEGTWLYPLAAVRGPFLEAIVLDEVVELSKGLAGRVRSWPTPHPLAANTLEAFEEARDLIEVAVFDWLTMFEERFEPGPSVPPHDLADSPVNVQAVA